MKKIEDMIGKIYYRPVPKINYQNSTKKFVVEEVELTKKKNTYYWGGEQCHSSWLAENTLIFFETKEECENKCIQLDYEYRFIEVTKNNVHLYYKFMNDENLIENAEILNNVFVNRFYEVSKILSITAPMLHSYSRYNYYNDLFVQQYIFNVQDTLMPIDEYINKIKSSDAFINFEKEKLINEQVDIANVVIIDFSEEEIAKYINRCIKYLNKISDLKYRFEIWETDEVYGQRDDEDDYSEEYQGHSMYQGKIAIYDEVFEKDIKFTGIYCEISAVFSDLLTHLRILENTNNKIDK